MFPIVLRAFLNQVSRNKEQAIQSNMNWYQIVQSALKNGI